MLIGHYQCVCHPGEFHQNLETVLRGLDEASRRGVEVMSFPESFLGGYWRREEKCRENAWPLDSPQTAELLERTRDYPVMFMVGFNERRGADLYNTVLVADRGELIGSYSKAFPVINYFKPGRETPVFKKRDLTFGIVICADGGYPEPTRIYAMKGAQVVFAPHYNYIGKDSLIDHYVHVRHDHVARAIENHIFFVRGNNVEVGNQPALESEGVGYGDSYILDPNGQIVAAANLHAETLLFADIDLDRKYYGLRNKSQRSAEAFWGQVGELLGQRPGGER